MADQIDRPRLGADSAQDHSTCATIEAIDPVGRQALATAALAGQSALARALHAPRPLRQVLGKLHLGTDTHQADSRHMSFTYHPLQLRHVHPLIPFFRYGM